MIRISWKIVWAGLCFLNLSLSWGATSEDTASGKDAKSFAREGMGENDPARQNKLLRKARDFLSDSMDAVVQEDLDKVISIIAPIPAGEVSYILEMATEFITDAMDNPLDILPVLKDIPVDKRPYVLEWVYSNFRLPNMKVFHYDKVINILKEIPTTDINDVLRTVGSFLTQNRGKISPDESIKIFSIIKKVSAEEDNTLLKWLVPFFTEAPSESDYDRIVQVIRGIPIDERDDVLERAHKWFATHRDKKGGYATIIEAIGKIEAGERDDVLGRASAFFIKFTMALLTK